MIVQYLFVTCMYTFIVAENYNVRFSDICCIQMSFEYLAYNTVTSRKPITENWWTKISYLPCFR